MRRKKVANERSSASLLALWTDGVWRGPVLLALVGTGLALLSGCVAQQADLKQTERELQRRIKQSTEELAQTRARQNQEIVSLREQDIPTLRGDVDKAIHRTQSLEARQDDLTAKLASQDSKLSQRIGESEKRSLEESKRLGWVEKQLVDQDAMLKGERERSKSELASTTSRMDQVTAHIDAVQKNMLDAVQKTTTALVQKIDSRLDDQQKRLDEQQKLAHALETRSHNVAQLDAQNKTLGDQVSKLNQALVDFKQALGGLAERVAQQDQTLRHLAASVEQDTTALSRRTDALAGKIDADNRVTSDHLNEVNRSVASVAKALENAGGKFVSRGEEQERRLDETSRELAHVQAQIQTLDKNLENQHTFLKQVEQHLSALRANASQRTEQASPVSEVAPLAQTQAMPSPERAQLPSSIQSAGVGSRSENRSAALMADRESYERTLTRFKEGDLDGARHGFAEFLFQHPHSDLAPNARFWLGESYYGKKDYPRAIDAYDQVQLNHPASEKVPAALLKKGYAYLALKDRKRAASALKQVIDLYPRSPEANKAIDKLNQLKESHER
ncbi:MAG: putative Tol-Pal system protein YbgF (modular protein) [Nitrospira sp.]|jgi:tol-pal system protein YbgF|nr:putative Tol-Pal system protein YbgF (modular protein) [Nitrospira sp.]